MSDYDPVSGENWSYGQGIQSWSSGSMRRAGPEWQLRGRPGAWKWNYWNFQSWQGWVTVESDGFHWKTVSFDTGDTIHEGVTTSIYAAYQSVVQNQPVSPPERVAGRTGNA
jgi:hypothetical protein